MAVRWVEALASWRLCGSLRALRDDGRDQEPTLDPTSPCLAPNPSYCPWAWLSCLGVIFSYKASLGIWKPL